MGNKHLGRRLVSITARFWHGLYFLWYSESYWCFLGKTAYPAVYMVEKRRQRLKSLAVFRHLKFKLRGKFKP